MVKVLDGLFEADGDEEAYDNGGNVDEEVLPCVGGVVGWVYVEHGGSGVRVAAIVSHTSGARHGAWRGKCKNEGWGERDGRLSQGVGIVGILRLRPSMKPTASAQDDGVLTGGGRR